MSGLVITQASPDDVPELTALVRAAYRGPESRRGWTTEADLLDDERIDEAAVREKVTRPGSLVLKGRLTEPEGPIIACCELAQKGPERAYFGMFAVQPGLQAAGLGRQLLAAAEREAQQRWHAIELEMTVIGQRAELIAWYERRGYRRTGQTRPFPFHELINGRALRDDLYFAVLQKDLEQA